MGGFITRARGWHAVVLAYLPVCLLALYLLTRLPEGMCGTGAAGGFDLPGTIRLADFIGPLLLMVAQLQRPNPAALTGLGART